MSDIAGCRRTGDPLVKLAGLIDFEVFRPRLAAALKRSDGSKGGRPPYDPVLMFKILVLQTLYTLSDDATEFQIRDRLSFMRFLELGFEDPVPDAKTIWLFREQLTRAGAVAELFAAFDGWLKGQGLPRHVRPDHRRLHHRRPAPAQHRRGEGGAEGGPDPGAAWKANPAKLAQKDRDARWTLKRAKARSAKADGTKAKVEIAIPVFGYKNHVSIDRAHGFIRRFAVTDAAAHDGARLAAVLDKTNTASDVWADTAYRSADQRGASRPKRLPLQGPLPPASRAST